MKKYFSHIKFILLLLLTGLVFGFTSKKNKQREVIATDIKFTNPTELFVDYQTVNNLLIQNNRPVKNQTKSLINLHLLESHIMGNPMIKKANVSVDILGNLEVAITQKKPIARVFDQGNSYYVDENGLKMPLSTKHAARVVVVNSVNTDVNIKEVYPLLKKIEGDSFFKDLIVSVTKTNVEGYVLKARHYRQDIVLGNCEDLQEKFKKIKVFYNYGKQDDEINTFKKINLQYHNQVVCSK